MVTASDVAGFPDVQVRLESKVQVITSPFPGTYVKVSAVAPVMLFPLTFHRYEGEFPPLYASAEKTTVSPWQAGFEDGVTTTPTGKLVVTIMWTIGEDAGFPETQGSVDVTWQWTESLLFGV